MKFAPRVQALVAPLRGALPGACLLLMISTPMLAVAADAGPGRQLNVMPMPSSIERGQGALVVTPASGNSSFTLSYQGISQASDPRLGAATTRMLARLDRACGGDVRRAQAGATADGKGTLVIDVARPGEAIQSVDEDESYTLNVSASGATLTAPTTLGAMHGLETLLQLVTLEGGACVLPAVTIHDSPRFAWRGLMLDVSRHFESIEEVKRTIDGMAVVKLNVFHWHLADDQGFRAESRRFPKLTSVGSGGSFYTQEQMRDVVAYARARGIRVVPEFDMPGHSSSWILAYPEYGSGEHITELPIVYGTPAAELDVSSEKTYKFIDAIVGEMSEIFPDAYFHIGGDEVEGKGWLDNPRIAAFMKKKGFTKPAELQADFNQRLLPILTRHHKKMIGWDEILSPALPKSIVIQSWRGEASLAEGATQGFTGILSAPYYLDAQKTSEEMFLADPVPADTKLTADQQKLILGGEATMWAEQIDQETIDSRVWPRAAAIAERFWSPQADRNVADMYRRLRLTSLELEDVGLTHIAGPEDLRRNLSGESHPAAFETFAAVLEPVGFGDRSPTQHTDGFTSLDRLVDAVVADPPSRQAITDEVDAAIVAHAVAPASGVLDGGWAAEALGARFATWQQASPQMVVWAARSPRLNDAAVRAQQLGALAVVGQQALDYLRTATMPPPAWKAAQLQVIANAEQPSALVRFTFLPSLRRLVEAAAR